MYYYFICSLYYAITINNKQQVPELIRMGAAGLTKTRSLQRFFPNFKRQDWVPVPFEQIQNQSRFGQFTTLKNTLTNEWIDRYQLNFHTEKEQRIYEQCFMQRLREDYLVNAFHYQPLKTQGFCSTARGAIVYIQHIPIRLCDVTDIPFEESLYIMKCALFGFEKLYNESGYFQVMEEHIGIDKEGHVRVWLNADVSKNYPYSFDQQTHQSKDYQKIMVGQIISIIEKNTNYEGNDESLSNNTSKQGYLPLTSYIQKNNLKHPSFRQAQQIIVQYAQKYGIKIPKRCISVIQIIQQTYGEQFNITNASNFTSRLKAQNAIFQQNIQLQSSRSRTVNLADQKNNRYAQLLNQNSLIKSNKNQLLSDSRRNQKYKQYEPLYNYQPNDIKMKKVSGAESSNKAFSNINNMKINSRSSNNQGNNIYGGSGYNTNRSHAISGIPLAGQHNSPKIHIMAQSNAQPSSRMASSRASGINQYEGNFSKMGSRIMQANPNIPKVTFSYSNKKISEKQIGNRVMKRIEPNQNSDGINININQNQFDEGRYPALDTNRSSSSFIDNLNKNKNKNNSRTIVVFPPQQQYLDQAVQVEIPQQNGKKNTNQQIQMQLERDIKLIMHQKENDLADSEYKIHEEIHEFGNNGNFVNQLEEMLNEQHIDPEIMRDLLREYPETKQAVA